MYKLLILEDKRTQFEDIFKNITNASFLLRSKGLLKHNIELSEYKCWRENLDLFIENYEKIRPDIVVLDFQLYWGHAQRPFDGPEVIDQIIKRTKNPLPFFFLVSTKFDIKFNPSMKRHTEIRVLSSLEEKNLFLDSDNIPELQTALIAATNQVNSVNPRTYIDTVEFPKSFNGTDEFHNTTRQVENILLYGKDLVAIPYNGHVFALIYRVNSKLIIRQYPYRKDKYGTLSFVRNELIRAGIDLMSDVGLMYNSIFIENVNAHGKSHYRLRSEEITDTEIIYYSDFLKYQIERAKELVESEIKAKKSTTPASADIKPIEHNPLYNIWSKFII